MAESAKFEMVITQLFELQPYGLASVSILTCGLICKILVELKNMSETCILIDLRWNAPVAQTYLNSLTVFKLPYIKIIQDSFIILVVLCLYWLLLYNTCVKGCHFLVEPTK